MDRKRAKLEEQQFLFILYVFHFQLHSRIYVTKHLHTQRQPEIHRFSDGLDLDGSCTI